MAKLALNRTLGPGVIRWIERNLVHGPGDVQGDRVQLDDEQVAFVMRAYEIDAVGKRVVRRAVYSRPKGRAKSELLAFIACAEALGPVRFAGWDSQGRPEGRTIQAPLIRLAATEEGQADNSYAPVVFMLKEGPLAKLPGLDVGITRIHTPGGGKILPITAKASSKDGGLETFVGFDETHLYVLPELHRLHATIRRNLGKRKIAEPWSMETSTMYAPGENSVAEFSHQYAKKVRAGKIKDAGFLFDHRQGPDQFDFHDDGQLRSALVEAYGEAASWMDLERLIAEARDPQTDENDFRRYFLNQPSERTQGKWITDDVWLPLASAVEIPSRGKIYVGVDAALSHDTSAVAWAWLEPDTETVVVRTRVWTVRPEVAHDVLHRERIDNEELEHFIRDDLAKRYRVDEIVYDPRYFASEAGHLARDGFRIASMEPKSKISRDAWNGFHQSVQDSKVAHRNDPTLNAHVAAASGKLTEIGWKVEKMNQKRPIDALAAVVMAHARAARSEGASSYETREMLVLG